MFFVSSTIPYFSLGVSITSSFLILLSTFLLWSMYVSLLIMSLNEFHFVYSEPIGSFPLVLGPWMFLFERVRISVLTHIYYDEYYPLLESLSLCNYMYWRRGILILSLPSTPLCSLPSCSHTMPWDLPSLSMYICLCAGMLGVNYRTGWLLSLMSPSWYVCPCPSQPCHPSCS